MPLIRIVNSVSLLHYKSKYADTYLHLFAYYSVKLLLATYNSARLSVILGVYFRHKKFQFEDEKSWYLPLDDCPKIDYIIYKLKKYEGSI